MTNHDKIVAIHAAFESAYPGVNPTLQYCQFTGKRIGRTDDSEFESLCLSLSGDPEEIADDIALRLFASMRPSMRWNKMRAESLKEMRKSAPLETLAYLLNRLFTPINSSNLLAIHHDRIRLWNRLEEWGFTESTNTILYYLLEIDAKLGLVTEPVPFSIEMLLDDFESMPLLLEAFEGWYNRRLKEYDKRLKQAEDSNRWFQTGNTLAKPAFYDAFMESKPKSESAKRAEAKREESEFLGKLLFEVLGKPQIDGTRTVPPREVERVKMPSTKMPKIFGGR